MEKKKAKEVPNTKLVKIRTHTQSTKYLWIFPRYWIKF